MNYLLISWRRFIDLKIYVHKQKNKLRIVLDAVYVSLTIDECNHRYFSELMHSLR